MIYSQIYNLFQGLLLRSDIQKSLTYAGLTPSPVRCDVQKNLTVSVIAFTCEILHTVIIKRFGRFVKVKSVTFNLLFLLFFE